MNLKVVMIALMIIFVSMYSVEAKIVPERVVRANSCDADAICEARSIVAKMGRIVSGLFIGGDLTVDGALYTNSIISKKGNLTLNADQEIILNDDVQIDNLQVLENSRFEGDTFFRDGVFIYDNLNVLQQTDFDGNVEFNDYVEFSDDVSFEEFVEFDDGADFSESVYMDDVHAQNLFVNYRIDVNTFSASVGNMTFYAPGDISFYQKTIFEDDVEMHEELLLRHDMRITDGDLDVRGIIEGNELIITGNVHLGSFVPPQAGAPHINMYGQTSFYHNVSFSQQQGSGNAYACFNYEGHLFRSQTPCN